MSSKVEGSLSLPPKMISFVPTDVQAMPPRGDGAIPDTFTIGDHNA